MKRSKLPLTKTHPHLLEIWDFDKNSINPEDITFGSHKRIYWKCPADTKHNYSTTLNSKTNNKSGCPYCSGLLVSEKNCLLTYYPEIVNEWDYTLNTINPSDISFSSHHKIWLKCHNNIHEPYLISPNSKFSNNNKCPKCSNHIKNIGLNIVSEECWLNKAIKNKKNAAKQKGKDWQLSKLECVELLTNPCFYCGRLFDKKMGIDRQDNNIGYVVNNCVSCCKFCNSAKLNMSIEEFKIWVYNAYHNISKGKVISHTTFSSCRNSSKLREIEFNLQMEDFNKIVNCCCYYCGNNTFIGVDRVDNNIGYILDNIVPCCKICNRAKLTQTTDEFRDMIIKLYDNYSNY